MLLVRGVPALFVYKGLLPARQRTSLMFLQATALPLLVVITEIGLSSDRMTQQNATALVGAGMVSVLAFPLIGFAILGRDGDGDGDDELDADGDEPRTAAGPEAFGEL